MNALESFNQALLDLDKALSEFIRSAPDLNELCSTLVAVNRFKGDLATVYDGLSTEVSTRMAQLPEVLLPDGSRVEKKVASDRRGWKHEPLALEVARRLNDMAIDLDTGEITMKPEEMVAKLLDYVQPSYWRVKELGKIGINADNYCEVGETKESVIVRKAK